MQRRHTPTTHTVSTAVSSSSLQGHDTYAILPWRKTHFLNVNFSKTLLLFIYSLLFFSFLCTFTKWKFRQIYRTCIDDLSPGGTVAQRFAVLPHRLKAPVLQALLLRLDSSNTIRLQCKTSWRQTLCIFNMNHTWDFLTNTYLCL